MWQKLKIRTKSFFRMLNQILGRGINTLAFIVNAIIATGILIAGSTWGTVLIFIIAWIAGSLGAAGIALFICLLCRVPYRLALKFLKGLNRRADESVKAMA